MLAGIQRCRLVLVRCFHASAVCSNIKTKNHYPMKVVSIKDTAMRLGFEKATDMYPEYPLEEPPKLWMVRQVHRLHFRPYWEKEIMKELGLHREEDICIQVNAPFMNEMLWQVKHLIEIKPVRFPQGIPTEEDVGFTQLKRNGEFVIYTKLDARPVDEKDVVPTAPEEDWKVVDGFRMCRGCKAKRCLKFGMCQKLWLQRGSNNLEKIGPRLFKYVDNPLKQAKLKEETAVDEETKILNSSSQG